MSPLFPKINPCVGESAMLIKRWGECKVLFPKILPTYETKMAASRTQGNV